MTTTLWNYFLAGSLGVMLQICAVKIPALRNASIKANHPFSFKEYLQNDWYAIIASFVTVGIFIICLDELLAIKPSLAAYIKWLFVFVGFTGSTIAQAILSVTNRKIMAIIDVKTNIADGVVPPVNADNVEGAKEIVKDEKNANG